MDILQKRSGKLGYPVRYTYDPQGRRTSLTTFRTTGAVALVATEGDTTTWAYDPATGNCLSKTYADGSTIAYTYTPDNLLLRTTYASGKWKENVYGAQRRLCGVVYSSPDMDYELQLDAYGRTVWESNSVCSIAYALADGGAATNEIVSVGDETTSITRTLDDQDRLVGLTIPDPGYEANYAYANDGSIESISNDLACVSYLYSSNRLDVGYSIRLANGTTIQRSLYRDEYRRSLVTNITTVVNGNNVEGFDYSFDAASRPITRNGDTFGYNMRNEVVEATISGNSETHEYDNIGNSTRASFNAVTNTFVANNLNQYTSINRNTGPLWETSYDIDGNMTQYGGWTYAYDAGHQLKSVSSNGVLLVTNYYDAKSRRVRKVTPNATMAFFYDDWNLIEEQVAYANGSTLIINYYWGKDLSGTFQGAGGIGGLLYLTVDEAIYIPCYDNNGNITRYLDANGNTVAQYTYDAFGNIISKSGPLADFFRHRFSTKYYDAETRLYYYGYRFYHPSLMRWLNRDPIDERGGLNLYGYCWNKTYLWDRLGLVAFIPKWVDNGVVNDGKNLWIAIWLWPQDPPEKGVIISQLKIEKSTLTDCDGNNLKKSTWAEYIATENSFSKKDFLKSSQKKRGAVFKASEGDQYDSGLYFSLIDTKYKGGFKGQNLKQCQKGEIVMKFTYSLYKSLSEEDDVFNDPRSFNGLETEAHFPFEPEINHKRFSPYPIEISCSEIICSETISISAKWNWCGEKEKVIIKTNLPKGPQRYGRSSKER